MKRLLLHSFLVTLALALTAPVADAKRKRGKGKAKDHFKYTQDAEVVVQESITVRVHGLRSGEGWVVCRIYDKKGWLKKAIQTVVGQIERRAAICLFEDMRPGTYAVAAFHDENKNGEPDTNGLGQPGEGVCATGYIQEIKEKPPFKKAKFTFPGGTLTKSVRMRYLPGTPDD